MSIEDNYLEEVKIEKNLKRSLKKKLNNANENVRTLGNSLYDSPHIRQQLELLRQQQKLQRQQQRLQRQSHWRKNDIGNFTNRELQNGNV
jgi:hypothetical protein